MIVDLTTRLAVRESRADRMGTDQLVSTFDIDYGIPRYWSTPMFDIRDQGSPYWLVDAYHFVGSDMDDPEVTVF